MHPIARPARPASRMRTRTMLALVVSASAFLVSFLAPALPGGVTAQGLCLAGTETDTSGERPSSPPPETRSPDPSVTVYVTSWCPACTMTINYLKKEKIPFTVKDVEKNRSYMDEMVRKTGAYRGVPVLEIDGKTYLGFHPSILEDLKKK